MSADEFFRIAGSVDNLGRSEPPGVLPGSRWAAIASKRAVDLTIAFVALPFLMPVFVLISVAIKIESPGPVFFRQRRTGLYGDVFWILKFRSMRSAEADEGGARQASRGDTRVTRVGKFVRATSLDELPQLVNVINGSMSLVGPRPHPLEMRVEGKSLDVAVAGYRLRHLAKPGITGWAQINGERGEVATIEQLRRRVSLDLEYVARWSLFLDFKILFMTAYTVISVRNAY